MTKYPLIITIKSKRTQGKKVLQMKKLKAFLGNIFSLDNDNASQDEIYNRLVNGANLRGTNMCVLILAILIASIGLNMNSTAVIIGAMLISPLMGSIMAIAYGVASGDLTIVRKYSIVFLIQVLISLLTSTLYFCITPISNSTSELLARITPTIWDILIAIFGGLAGIIGMTRKEKSNVIPGVAIATALMPPLCTAGYGLATKQWHYFFGAMYLFLLNSYFICFSSIAILLLLNVSKRTTRATQTYKTVRRKILISTIILIIPSILISAKMIRESNDVTGFQDPAVTKLEELGTEAEILFPQVESITVGDTLSYADGTVENSNKISVISGQPLKTAEMETLKKWIHSRYGEDIMIEFTTAQD